MIFNVGSGVVQVGEAGVWGDRVEVKVLEY